MSYDESAKLKELIEKKLQLDQEIAKFTRLVTVMFTDIVGSTSYFEKFGDIQGLLYVTNCIEKLSPLAVKHKGTICKTIGDALMAYFEDPLHAVQAAIEMQQVLEAYNQSQVEESEQVRVRIGMNYGPGMVREKDVFGDAVNAAARIENQAKSQQILISAAEEETRTRATLEERLRSASIVWRQLPEATVKGKAKKLAVYEIVWREASTAAPIEVEPYTPHMAGRVNVSKAAELPGEKGTVVIESPPVTTQVALRYSLVVVRPDGSHGMKYALDRPMITLGRVEGDIRFSDDPLVSRRHARFHISGNLLEVEDMNSANGIFRRLSKPHILRNGEIVLMGRQMFRFVDPGEGSLSGTPRPAETSGGEMPGSGPQLIRIKPGGIEDVHFPLMHGENILGRTRGTLTFPEDAYLSSQHCSIKLEDGKYVLEDLRAVNGTFVAIRERTALGDGDLLLVGSQLLRVTAEPA